MRDIEILRNQVEIMHTLSLLVIMSPLGPDLREQVVKQLEDRITATEKLF